MLIDLSVTLNQRTPVYPGDPAIKIEQAGVFERDGWNDHVISVNTHVGTHIDAPLHMIADGKTLDQVPIEQFVGRGRLVEVGKTFDLEELKQADIQEGDIVLFRTGMSEHYHEPVYFEEYPVMSKEIAQWLVERKVKMVGVDAGSVDNADDFPIHKILLGGNVLIVENLTNLDQLTGKGFTVYALPIKLDIDGAPARVIAEVK
ncbi:MAG TPA: cyclase family protein [Candidatus Saccharimonadales bacterium]|nr:cyclase family protein [Candidatus Saccharimonadales bacterium]